jgi:hypothetical protein
MRDTAAIFTGVGQKLNNMPYYRAKQYAQMLGIDENTLMAMRRGMNGFTADYQSMLQRRVSTLIKRLFSPTNS